jgi:hypothetical protein
VGSHLVSQLGVESLVIHGESIGGVAASATGRKLTEQPFLKEKVALLICDRTFCNLEAVAQRLVGGWSGYAIRMLAPLWSTDVAGDFLAASCPKVVATDSADQIIADSSSLKSGIAYWKEMRRPASSTKGIGWMMEAPLQYRMADWENVCVNGKKRPLPSFKELEYPDHGVQLQILGLFRLDFQELLLQCGLLTSTFLSKKVFISPPALKELESLHQQRRKSL